MFLRSRWLPHPLLSLLLILLWLLLNNSAAPGHLVLGAVFGILIPRFTERFWSEPVVLCRPGCAFRFAGRVLWDIVVANFAVAKIVLGPSDAVRPVFVRVPLDVQPEFAVTMLAAVISLTPGTVTVDVDPEQRFLLVHALSPDDPEALVHEIKIRYEAPIKEIFRC